MLVLALGLVFCLSQVGQAAPMGTAWTYQGRLMDANVPADGLYDLQFSLFPDPVLNLGQIGPPIDVNDIDIIDGYFTVELDFGNIAFKGDARWLQIGVRPWDSENRHTILSPRQEVTPTPYALYAQNANTDNDWMISGNNMYSIPSGNVGIGNSNPSSPLDVIGEDSYTIRAQNTADTGSATALYGNSNSTRGCGVRALAGAGSGSTYGVDAYVASPDGIGVYAFNEAESGNAYAIYGENGSPDGIALFAHASNSSERSANIGVYGRSDGDYGAAGVYGEATNTSGNNYGVKGHTNNSTGFAGYFTGGRNYFEGSVGIGTTSPEAKLHIKYSQPEIRFEETDQSNKKWHIAGYNTGLAFAETGEGYAMYIEPGGNVGIRTINPSAGLHLKGTSYPSSFMYLESSNNEDTGFRLYEGTTVKWHLFNESAAGGLSLRNNAYSSVLFAKQSTGDVGIGTRTPQAKLDVAGRTRTQILEITGGSDLSEQFEITGEHRKVEPGMVVCIDPASCGNLVVSQKAYDRTVAGIVSGAGGVKPGMLMGQQGTMADGEHPVALTGRAYCRADASNGPITPGDLLTTSDVAGHAMKVTDYERAQGAILGKAMSSLEEGRGLVLVLVSLQ